MGKRRFAVMSGFLGAGKTTTMLTIAKYLKEKGKTAAIISNDLGNANLVDALYTAKNHGNACQIAGGCICYCTPTLVDTIKRMTDAEGADIVMSDIPGCGVGALDHVYFTLDRDYHDDFELAPFTVVCDPLRLRAIVPEHRDINLPQEMNYLFRTQLLEADVIVLNKTDTITAQERDECLSFIRSAYPGIPVFAASAHTGEGIAELADYMMEHRARLVEVDTGYGGPEFMAAESKLSWYDRKLFIKKAEPFDVNEFMCDFAANVAQRLRRDKGNVPHLKLFASTASGEYAKASLIGIDYELTFDKRMDERFDAYSVVINARAACPSMRLDDIMADALTDAVESGGLFCHVFSTECFGMTDEGK